MGTQRMRGRRWMRGRWMRWLAGLGLTTAGIAWASAQGPGAGASQGAPHGTPHGVMPPKSYMNKSVFYLPVTLDERTRNALQEIHLYGKEDPSQPWMLRDKIAPNQNCFTFRAPRDGEYWFTVVTIDKSGRMVPPDVAAETPSVIVVLDSQQPQLDVSALPDSPEGSMVKLDIRDANLDASKTKFYYQTGDRMWRPLDPVAGRLDQFCIPRQAVLTGMIKVVCADFANNVVTKDLNLGALAPVSPFPTASNPPVPSPLPLPGAPGVPGVPGVEKNEGPALGSLPAKDTRQHPVITEGAPSAVVVTQHRTGPALPPPESVKVGGSKPNPIQQVDARAPVLPGGVKHGSTPLPTQEPPMATQAMAAQPTGAHKANRAAEPAALNTQIVNHTHLILDYQIEQMGASGVGKVEIWLTRDKGQTWHKHGEDTDRKSPAEVDLPGEGLYGISLVLTNGRGFGGAPPTTGDTPDWWVEVDVTRPLAELMSVRPGAPDEAGALNITWNARDKNFGAVPIELYYAAKKDGPWHSIVKGVRNDGHYRWAVPGDIGPHAFIRLVATDQAGNATSCESPQAVPLDDLSRPRGRVIGITTGGSRAALLPQLGER